MTVEIAPRIVFDPAAQPDKPVIEGTQVPVEAIIAGLAGGMGIEALAETYHITEADVRAALAYAAQKLAGEALATLLEESLRAGNQPQFVALVEAIDWSTRRPEELTRAIDLALSQEMTRLAVRLAELGGRLFPDHDRVQRAAKVLAAPPVVRKSKLPPIKGKQASMEWLQAHANQYRGQWVAVREGKLVGAAGSFKALMDTIGQHDDLISTIMTRVL